MTNPRLQQWLDTPIENITPDINNWMLEGLKAGLDALDLETGIFSEINGTDYTIRQVNSKMGEIFSAGDKFELCDTYCAAVAKEDKTVTYIQVGIIPEMILHPVYVAVQLESYIGSPIHDNDGKVTGTVNFSSHMVRDKEFDNSEIELVAQMAMKLGDVLYHQRS